MALGILLIMDIVFLILFIASILALTKYNKFKSKTQQIVYWLITIFSLILAFLAFTSLPSNFLIERIIAFLGGLLSIIAIILKNKNFSIARILLILSMLVSLIMLH